MFKTENKKQYLFAFRPLLFIFACAILTILGTFFFINRNIIGFCICLAFLAFFLFYIVYRKRYIVCVIALLLCFTSASIFVVDYVNFKNSRIDETISYTITGRADELFNSSATSSTRILHNCTIKNGEEVVFTNKNIQIVLIGSNLECGDIVTFKTTLTNPDYFSDIGATLYAYKNIDYTAMINYSSITDIKKDSLSIKEKLKLRALNILKDNMSEQSATLAYAVVFGDKTYLNYDIKNAFIESGIAHVLAVSGLHTSLIFVLLIFLFKKIRIKYGYKLAIIASFIGFFAYLCDFAPSVVRASIMAIVLSLTYLRSTKYDILNILSLTGALILLIQPQQLFNVGFVLSFSCMLSMILLDPVGRKITNFIPNTKIQSLFVSSITTTIGTLPVMALYFGKLSWTCIIANVILLPIFVYAYTFLFLAVVVSLFIPLTFLLHILDYVFISIIKICEFITLPTNDYVRIFKLGLIGSLLSFVLLFTLTKHFNLKAKYKIPLNIALVVCVAICAVYASVPKFQNNKVEAVANTSCVYCLNNSCSLFEPFASNNDYNKTKTYLENNNLYDIENMFVLDYNFVNINKIEYFTTEFRVENIYITSKSYNSMQYYLKNYFADCNVIILEQNLEYKTKNYVFNYVVIDSKSSMIAINNNNQFHYIYSKNATL